MSNVFSRDCGRSLKILSIKDHSETAWRQLSLILILSNSVRSEPFVSKRINKQDCGKLYVGRAFIVSYNFT